MATPLALLRGVVILSALFAPAIAGAAPILWVTGPESPNSPGSTGPAVYAQAFTLATDQAGLTFEADTICFSCLGSVLLTNDLGPTASFGNVFEAEMFNGQHQLLSNIALPAGTYFLVLALDSGTFGWRATTTPLIVSNGATADSSLLATTVALLPFQSNFSILRENYLFEIAGPSLPEPAVVLMLGSALALYRSFRCRTARRRQS